MASQIRMAEAAIRTAAELCSSEAQVDGLSYANLSQQKSPNGGRAFWSACLRFLNRWHPPVL